MFQVDTHLCSNSLKILKKVIISLLGVVICEIYNKEDKAMNFNFRKLGLKSA